ncbi:odorant receptor 82a-like [Hylaeus volcanicus]|uniref:odorant receptor 82a-like n=1 Tax=Hylaeus volcanicus TaxID=313075 RepID=UPI0023B870E2|nr:odorant receptor 82a-like [Hylaeus volcanicus]
MISIYSISYPVEIGLRLTGIWPSSHQNIFRFLWVVVMATAQISQYWYIIKHLNYNNFTKVVECVSTALPYSLFCFKLVTFWIKRGTFKNILTAMAMDWTNSSTGKLNSEVMINKANLSNRCSQLIMGVYILAVFLYSSVVVQFFLRVDDHDSDTNSRELLMKMEYPFASYSRPTYEYVLLVQFLQLLVTACGISMLDAFIITLVLHVGGQIELVHLTLADISPRQAKDGLPKCVIKQLFDRHKKIIIFTKDIENLFSYIALMQLLCNTLSICCIGFLMMVSLHSDKNVATLTKILFFYIAITLEAFIFCFAGEYLSTKSTSINSAAYNSVWYLLKPNDTRVILLLMLRSQKQLTISAGKFIDLSLEGFANILKTSASYMFVLYAMY